MRASTSSPTATSTPITVPGIGAVTVPCPCARGAVAVAASTSGARRRGRGGQVQAPRLPRTAPGAARSGGAESGAMLGQERGRRPRLPGRRGGATSQRRNGRFVTTPSTAVSSSAAREPVERLARGRRRGRSASRSSGRTRVPISSPSSTPASTRTADGQHEPRRAARPGGGTSADPPRRGAPRSRGPAAPARRSSVLARGDAELQLDEVEPGQLLGDRMLDLDAAVQLEEVDVGAVDEELGRAGAPVADRLVRRRPPPAATRAAQARGRGRGRGLLDELLVAPLHRAVALAEHGHAPCVSARSCTSTWRGRSR